MGAGRGCPVCGSKRIRRFRGGAASVGVNGVAGRGTKALISAVAARCCGGRVMTTLGGGAGSAIGATGEGGGGAGGGPAEGKGRRWRGTKAVISVVPVDTGALGAGAGGGGGAGGDAGAAVKGRRSRGMASLISMVPANDDRGRGAIGSAIGGAGERMGEGARGIAEVSADTGSLATRAASSRKA